MKKILKSLLLFMLILLPVVVQAKNNSSKQLVKVYVFEAGGCPYCELEMEYLEGLDSYNKKFEIVTKELYVDHIDWEQGADYNLGVKVATAFYNAGFTKASYQATPFVVISNLYAAAAYSTDLERFIDTAYENQSIDVVSCIDSGKTDCLSDIDQSEIDSASIDTDTTETTETNETTNDTNSTVMIIVVLIIVLGGVALIYVISKSE
jgi:thiol-disulfide isomerase/thioredoxin